LFLGHSVSDKMVPLHLKIVDFAFKFTDGQTMSHLTKSNSSHSGFKF